MEELKFMIRIVKPKYFMPIHGEYRMLKGHAELATTCGVAEDHCFVMHNGDTVEMLNGEVKRGKTVQAGDVYVDGSRIGDIGSVVIKDRKLMSRDGILVATINIDVKEHKLLIKPNVTTSGFVLVNENADLIKEIENKITEIINRELEKEGYNFIDLKNQIIL